jgi:oligosaccharide translocation protein RFT1
VYPLTLLLLCSAPLYSSSATGVAALLELCSEPLYIISSTRLEFGRRAGIDTAAMITKCGVTLLLVLHSNLQPALVFAASQLAFSCVVLGGYLLYGAQLWSQVGTAIGCVL